MPTLNKKRAIKHSRLKGILTDADIKKLKGVFTTSKDHVNLEEKVEKVTELVEKLPTRDEMERMLERTFGLTKLKAEHEHMKKIFREKFHINVEVEV